MPHRLVELEEALVARSDVNQAVVIDYADGAPILVLVKPEVICSGPELRDMCAAQLTADAARVVAVFVTEVPPCDEGYPDLQHVLSGPYVYRYEPPATATEKKLVAMWNELLGRERTGVLDDFLDLGGDSVLAVRLINRIVDEWGAPVNIVDFFDSPSVRSMATLVDSAGQAAELA